MRQNLDELLSPEFRRYLAAVRAYARGVVSFVLLVAVISVVTALVLPQWYASESTLLPPTEGPDSFSMMASLIQSSALSKIGMFSTQTPSDVFAEILRSRTLREDVIITFGLQRTYKAKNLDIALRRFDKHCKIDVDKAGVIHVRIEDRDPKRAAEMANHMVAGLDRFNRETYNTRAKRVRIFLEERLVDVTHRMSEAESTLTAYERANKVVATTETSAVSGIANIMAERMSLQVRRAYVASYSHGDSPALKQIDAEMQAYERELSKIPALKQEGSRLALEAELQRRLFSLITAQFEDARVQETRDTPTITVLDAARPSQMRARPKRGLLVAVSTGLAAALALGWIWLEQRRATAV
jgi:tyrosine-protein kinase Etk/Wzc